MSKFKEFQKEYKKFQKVTDKFIREVFAIVDDHVTGKANWLLGKEVEFKDCKLFKVGTIIDVFFEENYQVCVVIQTADGQRHKRFIDRVFEPGELF